MSDDVLQFLARNGTMLVGGATALLLLGALLAGAARSPVVRQRVCELSVLGALVWVVLACVPMRRVEWGNRDVRAAIAVGPVAAKPAGLTAADIPAELLAKPQATAVPQPAVTGVNLPVAITVDVRGWAVTAFLWGAGVCCVWLALGHVMLWRLVRGSAEAPGRVGRMIDSRLRPGLRRPRVRVCAGLSRPVTCGAWRPVILLPASLLREERAAQLRQVLLHELGHVHQRDGWGSMLFCAALPVLYFHPLYWWLRRGAELSRELVADDWAARADGKEAYVTQLVALARTRAAGRIGPVGAVGILQVRSHFYRRMRMLLQRHRPLATRCSSFCRVAMTAVTLGVVVGAGALMGVRPAVAQDAPPAPAPAPAPTPAPAPAPAKADSSTLAADGAQLDRLTQEQQVMELRLAQTQAQLAKLQKERELLLAQRQKMLEDAKRVDLDLARKAATPAPVPGRGGGGDAPKRPPTGQRWPGGFTPAERGANENPTGADVGPGTGRAVGGVQLDLVNLANTLVDAGGAVRLAKVNYEAHARLAKGGGGSSFDLESAKANLETAVKRLNLLRSIAEVALESAKEDLARSKAMYDKGVGDQQSLSEATSKVRMLELIVAGAQ